MAWTCVNFDAAYTTYNSSLNPSVIVNRYLYTDATRGDIVVVLVAHYPIVHRVGISPVFAVGAVTVGVALAMLHCAEPLLL